MRAFEQTAEVFFAGEMLRAFLVGEAGLGFVFHGEPFEPHDADVLPSLFPDLTLAQLHKSHHTGQIRVLTTGLSAKR